MNLEFIVQHRWISRHFR